MSSTTDGIKGSGGATLPMATLTAHATVSDSFEATITRSRRNRWRDASAFFAKEVLRSVIRYGTKEVLERLRDLLFAARARWRRVTVPAVQ